MTAVNERSSAAESVESREIVTTRLFAAPRELVFDVFTNREHISHWWGPRGFTTTTTEMDVRPGGVWTFVMHGPDGVDYNNRIVYTKVEKPERLEYDHSGDEGDVRFKATILFEEEGGKTRVTLRTLLESAAVREAMVKFGAVEGAEQTLERLEEVVARQVAQPFAITRTFDAPRELVFRVWTDCQHLARWWGPRGVTIEHCTNDLRRGGLFHYSMRTANGTLMWGRWLYREIAPPSRLVFVNSFSDETGRVTRPPFDDDWPLEMVATITFDEHDGRTTVTIETVPIDSSDAQSTVFANSHDSMQGGWSGTLDQLGDYLEKAVQ
ncbi:MAG TPA: SRPBCC family protein [Thermoanaerobaculia bacterium]|nr:SRPBCC family protein [Thermoanaerobaculia bacterium]